MKLGIKSVWWALLTFVVLLAAVCTPILAERDEGRSTFVRLTRTGLQRHCSPGASSHDVDDAGVSVDTTLSPPGTNRPFSDSTPAAIAPEVIKISPAFQDLGLTFSAAQPAVTTGCFPSLSDRAPPAL